jgi:hypothetical protein
MGRKTGIMTRNPTPWIHKLNKVEIKTKYVYLWKIDWKKPRRFLATEYYRKALREKNWSVFEELIDGTEAWEQSQFRKWLLKNDPLYY